MRSTLDFDQKTARSAGEMQLPPWLPALDHGPYQYGWLSFIMYKNL